MFSRNKTSESTISYCDSVKAAADAIKTAKHIVIGIGAGMTAAGGLNYSDPALAKKWYPEYYAMGKKSIIDIMSGFWPTSINKQNAAAFWGFWAKHIYHIRYEPEALTPYIDLFRIVGGKNHFICSTNVDGQLEKAGFEDSCIFAPQGDYALLQCEKPCSNDVYTNKEIVDAMFSNMASPLEIRKEDIPFCPRCGSFLMPNLRCDSRYVEKSHMRNAKPYERFLFEAVETESVLLELGVGYNTPGIIRFPFESITENYPSVTLIRVNLSDAAVPDRIADRAVSIKDDVGKALSDIIQNL